MSAGGLGWEARLLESVTDGELAVLLGVHAQTGEEAEHPDCLMAVFHQGTGVTIKNDLTHQGFGITGDHFQVLYHFTMGGPVDDPRLQTYPAYAHLNRAHGRDLFTE